MTRIELLSTTGDTVIDDVLRGIVGIYEVTFPGRVRGYYLKGSYASGTAVATSDVDLEILFKGALEGAELDRAEALIAHCRLLTHVGLDLGPVGEDEFLTGGAVDLKLATRLVYGEDVRDRVPLLPIRAWVRALMYGHPSFMARVRGLSLREPGAALTYPLDYPDPLGEFFGYDRAAVWCRDGVTRPSTKDLVRIVTGAASGLAAWRGGRYVASKSESVRAYREVVHDEWTPLVEEIDARCRAEWTYLVPEQAAARERLRTLCRQALAFENHFLARLRDFTLEELAPPEGHGGPANAREAWQGVISALRVLKSVRFPGDQQLQGALAGLAGGATTPAHIREHMQTAQRLLAHQLG